MTILTDWTLVVACLHYDGAARGMLTERDKVRAIELADGFGRMTEAQLRELDVLWDWSHVRDSTAPAIAAIAAFLRSRLGSKLLQVQRAVQAARVEG